MPKGALCRPFNSLVKVGKTLDIEVLDHLVIAQVACGGFVSLNEKNQGIG